jgi:hypothetical protein
MFRRGRNICHHTRKLRLADGRWIVHILKYLNSERGHFLFGDGYAETTVVLGLYLSHSLLEAFESLV